eukprot:jgi/Bigna1/75870/fgenesh1_pg.37_\
MRTTNKTDDEDMDEDEDNDEGWMTHALEFKKRPQDYDPMARNPDAAENVVGGGAKEGDMRVRTTGEEEAVKAAATAEGERTGGIEEGVEMTIAGKEIGVIEIGEEVGGTKDLQGAGDGVAPDKILGGDVVWEGCRYELGI